jgi:hypothetical protein
MGLAADARAQVVLLGRVELAPEQAFLAALRAGVLDDQGREVVEHVGQVVGPAAPEGGDARNLQLLAEEAAAELGQKGGEPGVLHGAAADGVGHDQAAGARALQQPRHAEERLLAQLQGVAPLVVHPAQDRVDPLQPAQGAQPQRPVPHREVGALHEVVAKVVGQVGVLEVGLVAGPRGEQGDAGMLVAARREAGERAAQGAEEAG